jgi:hypothetical protein
VPALNPPHTPSALHKVTPHHVLSESLNSSRVECRQKREIGASGMDLIVQSEHFCRLDPTLIDFDDAHGCSDKHHLPVGFIKEDDPLTPLEARFEKKLGNLEVG